MIFGQNDGILLVIAIVNNSQNFIHTLDILYSRIQLCVDKKYTMKHITVGFDVVRFVLGFHIRLFCVRLLFQLL